MTQKKFIDEALVGQPLKIYWTYTDDFDEEVEEDLYVCLATNKTFQSIDRGILHFTKDKEAKKNHIKAVKELKKEIEKSRKQKFKTIKANSFYEKEQALIKAEDPTLARAIWRGILYHIQKCKVGLWFADLQGWSSEAPCGYWNHNERCFEEMFWSELKDRIEKAVARVEQLQQEKCLNPKLLQPLYYNLFFLWDKTLRDTMPTCPDFQNTINIKDYTEEFMYYANDTMVGVDF